MADRESKREQVLRWLGISVGGTLLPFGILELAFLLHDDRWPSLVAMLGQGTLFIPASIVCVEVMWIWRQMGGWGQKFWFPMILSLCSVAALAGVVCFGLTVAFDLPSGLHVKVPQATVRVLTNQGSNRAQIVTFLSLDQFLGAFSLGTIGVVMLMIGKAPKASKGEKAGTANE
jgi:hypothetical protein